jgi:hypothetical protein
MSNNPLLNITTDALGLPAFGAIQPEHFHAGVPRRDGGAAPRHRRHHGESRAGDFANTIVLLEREDLALDISPASSFTSRALTPTTPCRPSSAKSRR